MSETDGLVGQVLLGKLEVVRRLGGGGMGDVYEVVHRLTGHRRALKVVRPEYADRPRFMKRLLREAKVAGTLGSRFVVETYDAGRLEDGSAYVLMELLAGRNLYEVLQQELTLDPGRLAAIVVQVTEGIGAAHEASIVHRDLKPENVFLLGEGEHERVKILDFGVSKFDDASLEGLGASPDRLTAEGTLVGTPYYMSPEQAGGREVDGRSDVYALGVMMYEALTGRLPYDASSVGELFVKIGAGQCVPLSARRPDLDARWSEVVHRAFHRDPEQRYPSAEALRRDLLPLAGGVAAARAKTLSDGARDTLSYGASPLPPPPAVPRELAAAERETLDAAPSAPPSRPPSPRRRASGPSERASSSPAASPDAGEATGPSPAAAPPPDPARRGGAWALAGVAAVGLALLPLWLVVRPDEPSAAHAPDAADAANAAPTPAPEEAALAAAASDEAPGEGEAEPAPPLEAESATEAPAERDAERGAPGGRGRREETRAAAAGLDPNPYR